MRRIRAYVQPDRPDLSFTETAQIRARVASEPRTAKRVFMSHKSDDYNDAKVVGRRLLNAGLAVYFVHDDPSVAPGDRDHLPYEVKDAVRRSAGLLVYASDKLVVLDSSWVCFEVGLAEMRNIETARYTTTARSSELLSPIRGLARVEYTLSQWATKLKYG